MSNVFIVAEIGINHNGNIETALEIIELAVKAGFDAVKFQKRNPELYSERPYFSAVLGDTTYREHKRALEFGYDEYSVIDAYCKDRDIKWFASCFDYDSIDFISQFDTGVWKIPSPAIHNLGLVRHFASQKGKCWMSTGMSEWKEIVDAIKAFKSAKCAELVDLHDQLGIVHCCSEYPCPVDHVNLAMVRHYTELYPMLDIGYSSHDGGVPIPVCAVALGAKYIEVHVTKNRMLAGSDHSASLEYRGMETLVRHIRAIERALGVPYNVFYEGERKIREKVQVSS
jgi:N-acetylneuraminate synthase